MACINGPKRGKCYHVCGSNNVKKFTIVLINQDRQITNILYSNISYASIFNICRLKLYKTNRQLSIFAYFFISFVPFL